MNDSGALIEHGTDELVLDEQEYDDPSWYNTD
jgi:hypothetical protein